MDGLRELMNDLRRRGLTSGNFLGLLNVLIGRRIESSTGHMLANGLTWRSLAELLKRVRWEKEAVRDLGLEPADLPPKDRQRYWYAAISRAHVDSAEAARAGDRMVEVLRSAGFRVGPSPQKSTTTARSETSS
jgi:hypothetical protein